MKLEKEILNNHNPNKNMKDKSRAVWVEPHSTPTPRLAGSILNMPVKFQSETIPMDSSSLGAQLVVSLGDGEQLKATKGSFSKSHLVQALFPSPCFRSTLN